jgi:hypothetical protein
VVFCSGYDSAPDSAAAYDISRSTANPSRYVILTIATLNPVTLISAEMWDGSGAHNAVTVFSASPSSHFIIGLFPTGSIVTVGAVWSSHPSGTSGSTGVYCADKLLSTIPVDSASDVASATTTLSVIAQEGGAIFETVFTSGSSGFGTLGVPADVAPPAIQTVRRGLFGSVGAGMGYVPSTSGSSYPLVASAPVATLRSGVIAIR